MLAFTSWVVNASLVHLKLSMTIFLKFKIIFYTHCLNAAWTMLSEMAKLNIWIVPDNTKLDSD